jgi:putative addiction module component (TIGR02574 family)
MSPSTEQLFQAAQSLPEADQVELIDALITALDEANSRPLDAAWLQEIQRRSAEYDAGQIIPVPWAEVRTRLNLATFRT